MSDKTSKPSLEEVLSGKTEILPDSNKTGEQVLVTSSNPKVKQPDYLAGETIQTGGTVYDGSEPVFAEDDGSVADATAPPPPPSYDLFTASLLSYLLPLAGPFIVLGAVNKESKNQRFVALQALVIQFLSFIILSSIFGVANYLRTPEHFFVVKFFGVFLSIIGKILVFGIICIVLFCAFGSRRQPIRLPFIAEFVDSQLK